MTELNKKDIDLIVNHENTYNSFFFTGLISIYSISCALSITKDSIRFLIVNDRFLNHISIFGGKNWVAVKCKNKTEEAQCIVGHLFDVPVMICNSLEKKNFIIASVDETGNINATKYQTGKGH